MRKEMLLFVTGYTVYFLTELIWRKQMPSYTMALVGGAAMLTINRFCYEKMAGENFLFICMFSSLWITNLELIAGLVFNRVFHMNLWDYSGHTFHLFGQITPYYTFLWFLISIPAVFVCILCSRSKFLSESDGPTPYYHLKRTL